MASNKSLKEIYPYAHKYDPDVIGIEIEMEGQGLATIQERLDGISSPKNMWFQKGDGSLRGESCEWVLARPLEPIKAYEWLDRLWDMQDILTVARFQPSRRCGVHIHVNCQELTQKQVYNFIAMYLLWENILIQWAGHEREGNFFCLRGMDARYLTARLAHHRQTDQWRDLQDDLVRYAALNVGALFRFGSLEFRALPTPSNTNRTIKDWANMMIQLKRASLAVSTPRDIITKFSQLGATEYMVRVFGTNTPLLKVGKLQELGKQGMRNLQDMALLAPTWAPDSTAKDGHWYASQGVMDDDVLAMLEEEQGLDFPDDDEPMEDNF